MSAPHHKPGTALDHLFTPTNSPNLTHWIVISNDQTLYHRPTGTVLPFKTATIYTYGRVSKGTLDLHTDVGPADAQGLPTILRKYTHPDRPRHARSGMWPKPNAKFTSAPISQFIRWDGEVIFGATK